MKGLMKIKNRYSYYTNAKIVKYLQYYSDESDRNFAIANNDYVRKIDYCFRRLIQKNIYQISKSHKLTISTKILISHYGFKWK